MAITVYEKADGTRARLASDGYCDFGSWDKRFETEAEGDRYLRADGFEVVGYEN